MILLNLKRNDIDYYVKAREALLNADEAIKRKVKLNFYKNYFCNQKIHISG